MSSTEELKAAAVSLHALHNLHKSYGPPDSPEKFQEGCTPICFSEGKYFQQADYVKHSRILDSKRFPE